MGWVVMLEGEELEWSGLVGLVAFDVCLAARVLCQGEWVLTLASPHTSPQCNSCMSMGLFRRHKCRENALESDCPVCHEHLFESAQVRDGGTLQSECVKCGICSSPHR